MQIRVRCLNGVTMRKAADGRRVLSYPGRRDAIGRQQHYFRPLDDHARREIEHAVFQALAIEEK